MRALAGVACNTSGPASERASAEATAAATQPPSDVGLAESKFGIRDCDVYVVAMNECLLPALSAAERDDRLAALKQKVGARREQQEKAKDVRELASACRGAMASDLGELRSRGCLK